MHTSCGAYAIVPAAGSGRRFGGPVKKQFLLLNGKEILIRLLKDQGYDISDYKNIHPDYGDLEQFQKVLDKAHSLGLRVIMDLVVNHTSDEHPWFLESKKSRDNPYSDYYIWRDGKNGKLPNNWDSLFEGKAWEYCPERDQYYLHIFAKIPGGAQIHANG